MINKKTLILLLAIFLLSLAIRFLYFPQNIYFGFDQARDAFTSLEITKGHLKVVGPPTGVDGLNHGVLYYYLFSPVYFLSQGNPAAISVFLRIINSFGIFLIFITSTVIFNKSVGIFSAFLFAISFEQSQYALYLNHPPLAVITVLTFYLGLALFLFRKKSWGIILSAISMGLSIQFEFVLIYLVPIFLFILLVYELSRLKPWYPQATPSASSNRSIHPRRYVGVLLNNYKKYLPNLNPKYYIIPLSGFLISIATFIISAVKFHSFSLPLLLSLIPKLHTSSSTNSLPFYQNIYLIISRFINDNIINSGQLYNPVVLILVIIMIIILLKKDCQSRLLFLLIWTLAGTLPYLSNQSPTPLYYYSVGASLGLIIIVSLGIETIITKSKIVGIFFLIILFASNLSLITSQNPKGSISTINVQSGMLLTNELSVVDYIYSEAQGKAFAVNAVTMPFGINTTWSYLFEWYGYRNYRYLPIWGGNTASGYLGNLKIVEARSRLPYLRFTIIEPKRGIRAGLIDNFLTEENYFSKVIREQRIGDFMIQERIAI